ncbi:Dienelactone hydrolase [Streptosporangium subroseum]|uniref:Dienelactone hydrolase n=1 Tax=Streptosporangium subroseum TaxID=106412 RepID=A0A239JWE1_9ACTN|nr:dienelactone hydrolase family protein [Streptosporangium subroseum]SNT09174.1 Dienelactone hydrolase [Streptosporangium subroseum]
MNAVRMNLERLEIPAVDVVLEADVAVPRQAQGMVLFAHGSGSSRHSPRNRYVAGELQRAGLATILADLLTPAEERVDIQTGEFRFDIGRLAIRLAALADWLVEHRPTADLRVGLFGASTGAAAALVAAAARPALMKTVVSRGGRPDLAGTALQSVHQPTLLIVGERDPAVLNLNREAMRELRGETRLEIVPGASHLFEEPGTLEQVAHLAGEWFLRHLPQTPGREGDAAESL